MKKITYTCDRCRKEITGGVLQIFPQYIEPGSGDYEEKQPYEAQLGRHYCEECAKLVMDLLESQETKAFFQGGRIRRKIIRSLKKTIRDCWKRIKKKIRYRRGKQPPG